MHPHRGAAPISVLLEDYHEQVSVSLHCLPIVTLRMKLREAPYLRTLIFVGDWNVKNHPSNLQRPPANQLCTVLSTCMRFILIFVLVFSQVTVRIGPEHMHRDPTPSSAIPEIKS